MRLHLCETENEYRAMTEEVEQERRTLEGEAALRLWRQGQEAWNSWIDEHPGWNISFAGIDFSTERDIEDKLSFAGYNFGDGYVDFARATFSDSHVHFTKAIFGLGAVYFSRTTFSNCDVFFAGATFGNDDVTFAKAIFSDSNVYFFGANFGDCDFYFHEVAFGNGNLYFSDATFGNGNVYFDQSTFRNGKIGFFRATFGNDEITFHGATFSNCAISFNQAQFNDLTFDPKTIESSHIEAEGLSIKGRAIFYICSSNIELKSFNFHSASFDGPLTIKGDLNIIPDLRATRYSHQVDLSDLKVKLPRISPKLGWPPKLSRVAESKHDGARLRRLKEIAETNKDHHAALRFSADENKARRWIETSWFGSVLDMAFSACSNYGQSILRPFVALFFVAVASMGLYKKLAAATFTALWTEPGWGQSLLLSAGNSLPFLPQSRSLRDDAIKVLYSNDPSLLVDAIMIGQGALSFIFLFLIGLGLRNRFRL
ncbi:MAG: hypothetical protein CMO07_00275 [Thalassospira sp.]|nr:hypothetical protein [Thalassospira sp.]